MATMDGKSLATVDGVTTPTVDGERLRKLLGGAEFAPLRLRLRSRYERGAPGDEFTLSDLEVHERRVLADLLGRRIVAAGSMRLRRSDLDAALAHAGIAATLHDALVFLDGPLTNRRVERASREQAWTAVRAGITEPRLAALLGGVSGAALLKRLSAGDVPKAESLLRQAGRVVGRLPAQSISRAQLAAETLGDSHGLDEGRPVATLVLRACVDPAAEAAAATDLQTGEETTRERWTHLGVMVNELALPVLCLNLPLEDAGAAWAAPGEPVHLSLRKLMHAPPTWQVENRDVFVCENPNVVAIAADRLGAVCAPLVCTDGMPSAAPQTLLRLLRIAGARLRYHGDFDWPGLVIGNFVLREFGAAPWRFGAAEYRAATADYPLPLNTEAPVIARWDPALAEAMAGRGIVVHEEAVIAELLRDLAATSSAGAR